MPNTVNVGSVLIEVDTCLPHAVRTERDAFSSTWEILIRPDRRTFETELGAAGWNLFYLAGKTTATVFGFDTANTLHRAVDRVLEQIRAQGFNCAEITDLATGSLWRVPYATVSAHARHIQPGIVLASRKDRSSVSKTSSALIEAIAGA